MRASLLLQGGECRGRKREEEACDAGPKGESAPASGCPIPAGRLACHLSALRCPAGMIVGLRPLAGLPQTTVMPLQTFRRGCNLNAELREHVGVTSLF